MVKAKYRIRDYNGTGRYVTLPDAVLLKLGILNLDGSLNSDCIRFKETSVGVVLEPAF